MDAKVFEFPRFRRTWTPQPGKNSRNTRPSSARPYGEVDFYCNSFGFGENGRQMDVEFLKVKRGQVSIVIVMLIV